MDKFQRITEARALLNLPERASMEEIKSNYRKLLGEWHPDKCGQEVERCEEMTRKIVEAYRTIMAYCGKYKFSFSKEEVNKYLSDEEWWLDRFGTDPVWGRGRGY